MATARQSKPDVSEINQAIIQLVNFFGSIISTPNMHEDTVRKCNTQVRKLVDLMDHEVSEVTSLKIGATGSIKLLN